jgi:hypothetical protein
MECPLSRGGLNRSAQHFILNGRDGVFGYVSKISSRFYCGREDGVMGSLAARGVFERDWTSIWQAVIVYSSPSIPHGEIRPAPRRRSGLSLTLSEREEISRGLAVILAADVVGYSRLMERDEAPARWRR